MHGRRLIWERCVFVDEHLFVEGVLRDTEIGEHLIVSANGGDFEVVVTGIGNGVHVRAVDVPAWQARQAGQGCA